MCWRFRNALVSLFALLEPEKRMVFVPDSHLPSTVMAFVTVAHVTHAAILRASSVARSFFSCHFTLTHNPSIQRDGGLASLTA